MKVKRRRLLTCVLTVLAAFSLAMGMTGVRSAYAAAGDIPDHDKLIEDNKDGTYTLSLDVLGESEKKPNNVNVTVIFDTSSSMNTRTGNTEVTYTETDDDGGYWYQDNLYGLIDGEYHLLDRTTVGRWPNITYQFTYNGREYTGQRYYRQAANQTRLEAAEDAVNLLAKQLLSYNGKDGNPDDTVEMALVDFANMAEIAQEPTTDYASFEAVVNSRDAGNNNRGTNWEAGLRTANDVDYGDKDTTYVIFVSDGNPTFWVNDDGSQGGSGSETRPADNVSDSYDEAVPAAQALAESVGAENFYTIGIYGNVNRMQNLTTAAGAPSSNYYSAEDTAALQSALAAILEKIEMSGIGNASIQDGTTNRVTTSSGDIAELLEVVPDSYKYYRSGGSYGEKQAWSDAPKATFENGAVKWDLSSLGVLENGVRYTVTFDVYPSQETYDTIAKLKNGKIAYDSLDSEIKKYIVDNGNGSYSLLTNTKATLSYNDTRTDDGQKNVGYTDPKPVKTEAATMSVKKTFENTLDARKLGSIDMTVLMDGESFQEVKLTDPEWSKDPIYVSPGIIKGGKVLTGAEGHDFTFAELSSEQYNWELVSPTVHPMIIDGTLTMLTLVDDAHPAPSGAQTYTINSKTYYSNGSSAASLDAYNYRRSNLNLTKLVTGEDAPASATFPFTLTVNNSKASSGSSSDTNSDYYVWFSIYDTKEGAAVKDATVTGATAEAGDTGYYYAPSGSAITVQMKDGWNLRFINLPTGTKYSFAEGDMPKGFAFNKAELTEGKDSTFSGAKTTTGTIEATNTVYTVTYTNDYELTNLEITKVWSDAKNQDGKRPTADAFKNLLTLEPAVQGAEPTIKDNGDNTYTITYTGLPRFNNGTEVEYTVAEGAIDGYTTTGSPAKDHGTITNTHETETTEVKVTKVWEDADNQDGIRPDAITVQLSANGTAKGEAVTLNEANNWTTTWTGLDAYEGGKKIEYTVDETAVPTGYTKTISGTAAAGYTITNTHTPATTSVEVHKVWVDGGTKDRPTSVTVNLVADGKTIDSQTLNEENSWQYAWDNLPVNAAGKAIAYEVTEDTVPNYASEVAVEQTDEGYVVNVYNGNVTLDTDATDFFTKTVTTPNTIADAEFTFKIEAVTEGAPMPTADKTTGSVKYAKGETGTKAIDFGDIIYTAAGEYTYKITETSKPAGWTSNPASGEAIVTVKVTGNPKDTFEVEVTQGNIENNYAAAAVKASFPVAKDLVVPADVTGPAEWSYTINVAANDGAPEADTMTGTVSNTAKTVTFGDFTYTKAGTYTYTVTETGTVAGVTNDRAATTGKTVTVTVTDNGEGALVASVDSTTDKPLTFTNTYATEPAKLALGASKTLEVKDPANNPPDVSGKYTFTITANDGTPLPATTSVTNPDGKGTAVSFGDIEYTKPGEYQYTITESGNVAGVTNGTTSYTVKVAVTDNGKGALEAKVVEGNQTTAFTNTYEVKSVELPTEDQFHVTKSLTGTPLSAGAFQFELTGADGAPMPENNKTTNDADGKATFGSITYDKPGTYTYTINEVNTGKKGYTYDAKTVTVTVEVKDNGEGQLVAKVSYDDETPFANSYAASGTVSLSVAKKLNGRAIEKDQFKFELVDENNKVIQTKTNNESGAVDFDPITYTQDDFNAAADAAKTDEATTDETAATTEEPATTDAEISGQAAVTPVEDAAEAVDETEVAEVEAAPAEAEAVEAEAAPAEAEAESEITDVAEAEDDGISVSDIAGFISRNVFAPKIAWAEEAGEESGTDTAQRAVTRTYTIREVNDGKAGYTYDSHEVKVTVTIVDNGDGSITATPKYEGDTEFVNTYEAKGATGENAIAGTKVSNKLDEGQFTFQLKEGNEVIEQVTNNADGSFAFSALSYVKNADKDETGKHEYTIVEVNDGQTGYTYDGHELKVIVTVTDNGNGTLNCDVAYEGSTEFNNPYKPLATSITLSATKQMTGRALKAGEFTFELRDSAGTVIATATNAADGTIDFGSIPFDKVGEYTLTATEVKGSDKNVTYDESEQIFKVTVLDENGQLVAAVTNPGEQVFQNKYTEPPVPSTPKRKKVLPQTSDDSVPTSILVAGGIAGVSLVAAGLGMRLRKEED